MKTRAILIMLIAIVNVLLARENPFIPVSDDKKQATNIDDNTQPLTKTTIKPPSSARVLSFVTLMYQNVNGSTTSEKVVINKKIDWRQDIVISQDQTKTSSKNRQSSKYIAFKKFFNIKIEDNHTIKLITKDKNIRVLSSAKPYKIIVDFKRENSFATKSQKFKDLPVKKITLGSHKHFYRATIELDGHYKYKLEKRNYGYLLKLI